MARMDEAGVVAPHAGAWIEMCAYGCTNGRKAWSHPMRVRGLKFRRPILPGGWAKVAPHAGAWIEILYRLR